jgi:hypothetical protein
MDSRMLRTALHANSFWPGDALQSTDRGQDFAPRRLMEIRRSGTLEAIAGDAEGFGLAAQIAESRFAASAIRRGYVERLIPDCRGSSAGSTRAVPHQFVADHLPIGTSNASNDENRHGAPRVLSRMS